MSFCWHRWTKWEQYEQQYGWWPTMSAEILHAVGGLEKVKATRTRIREKRHCEKCGKLQDHVAAELYGD